MLTSELAVNYVRRRNVRQNPYPHVQVENAYGHMPAHIYHNMISHHLTKSKAIERLYSKPDSAYRTALAKFAYLLPAEAGTHLTSI